MKKITFLLASISLLLFGFFSCEQTDLSLTPEVDNTSEFGQSFAKKPSSQPTIIELFEISENGGDPIYSIVNNEVQTADGQFLDFSTTSYRIRYRLTNPSDIWYIRVLFIYDENINNENEFGPHETPVWVLKDEREGENDTVVEGEIENWNGEVFVHSWDYGLYLPDDRFTLFDQLATYNESGTLTNPDPGDEADHYICYIWIVSNAPIIQVKSDFWIKAANSPAITYHVNDVDVWGEKISKNKVKSFAKVHVVDDYGSNQAGAIVYGKWGGLNSSIFVDAITDIDGIAHFTNGPKLRNNLSGEEIFTVYSIRFPWGAYNPYENTNWNWPNLRASGSFFMPLP